MLKNLKFLIFTLILFPAISMGCELDRSFNYIFSDPMAKQLINRVGLLENDYSGHFLSDYSLPIIHFIAADEPVSATDKKTTIYRMPRGPDIFNNVWSTALLIEPYLKNCAENFLRLISYINNMKHSFKKFGDIKSRVRFVNGRHLDDSDIEQFQEKFNVILEKYGLQTSNSKNAFEVIVKINKLIRYKGHRIQSFNYLGSTADTIDYEFNTTDINDNDFHSFESLGQLISSINSELPIRFKHGSYLGWAKSPFKYLDPFSEYDIGIFIRSLTLLFVLIYVALFFPKIKDAWTRKA